MSNIIELENCPELNFIENMTLQETEDQMRELYAGYYRELTGRDPEIGDADTVNLLIKAFCAMEYQTMQYADAKGRMEMLKTSTGSVVVAIPAGTRVKTEDGKYFNSLEYAEIKAGEGYADVVVQAEEAGAESSGILSGAIKILVDPIPYISGVSNTTPSTGGLDTEDDDSLTRRIYLAPSVYSCAGPRDAYEYYAREWRGDVADVRIVSPQPDEVNIYFVIEDENGLRVPNSTELTAMAAYLDDETIRPLCDKVTALAPDEVEYAITVKYWIAESDQRSVSEIQSRIAAAVADFQTWQRKLGRDINPTELIARLREAGAKRVTLTAPVDTVIDTTELPKCTGATATYKSLKNAQIADGLPRILGEQPWVKALSMAMLELHQKTMGYIAGSQIYTAIDTVAEEVLDALAVNWKIDWYDTGYDIEQKRRIVKTALNIRRTMGTAGAARTQADAIYPGTKLEEWFEYGGTHGKFRLRVNITTVEERQKFAAMTIAEIERRLAAAKRFSAHLEEVEYYDAGGTATAYGIAAMAGAAVVDFGSASKF